MGQDLLPTPDEAVREYDAKTAKALENTLKVQYIKELRKQVAECYKVRRGGVGYVSGWPGG